jgi:hypothetical protein
MSVRVGVAGISLPQGHADEIRYSLKARVDYLVPRLDKHNIDVLGMWEYGPLFNDAWKAHKGWKIVMGSNNSYPGRRYTCNAFAVRTEVYKKVTDKRELRFNAKGRILYSVGVLLEHVNGEQHPYVVSHVPRKQDAAYRAAQQEPKRRLMNERLIGWARSMGDVIVIADRNDGNPAPWLESGFRKGNQHHVDYIFGRGPRQGKEGVKFDNPGEDTTVRGRSTDHAAMPYVTAILTGRNEEYDDCLRLPKG